MLTSFTDALDGAMARTRNQVTNLGKMLDPLADKILICTVAYILVLKYLDVYTAWVVIILELIIIVAALLKYKRGEEHPQANSW